MSRFLYCLIAIVLVSLGCGGKQYYRDPYQLGYRRTEGTASFLVGFRNGNTIVVDRVDNMKPGANQPTYVFVSPVTVTNSLTFAYMVSGHTVTGTFIDTGKWAGGQSDSPLLPVAEYRLYDLELRFGNSETVSTYRGGI